MAVVPEGLELADLPSSRTATSAGGPGGRGEPDAILPHLSPPDMSTDVWQHRLPLAPAAALCHQDADVGASWPPASPHQGTSLSSLSLPSIMGGSGPSAKDSQQSSALRLSLASSSRASVSPVSSSLWLLCTPSASSALPCSARPQQRASQQPRSQARARRDTGPECPAKLILP